MENLQTGRNIHDAREVAGWLEGLERVESIPTRADGVPTPIAKECAESFASAEQSAGVVDEGDEFGGDRGNSNAPWSDQSGSTLARDAGINDIGTSGHHADNSSGAGLFDQASNDSHDDGFDTDSGDFGGGGGDSDSA